MLSQCDCKIANNEEISNNNTLLDSFLSFPKFNYDIVLKNNGTGTVNATDTMALQLVCFAGSNLIFAYPSSTQIVLKAVGKTMAPGDTIHWKGSLTAPVKANFSFNCSFQAYSEVRRFTGADPITPETSATNANNVKVNKTISIYIQTL